MPKICRVALIGQKFMGKAHSNAWSQAPKFFDLACEPRMHTVAAKDGKSLREFAARFGWENSSDDWRTILEDPEVDLVDVATPNFLHAEQAVASLEAGKHVACEKPLSGELSEARAMVEAARSARRKTFVWFNYRRCPAVATAWNLIQEGRLGRIHHIRATYLQSWGGPDTPLSWRFQKKLAGSGAHGDLNAHIVDLARFLSGSEVDRVHGAVAKTFVKERPIQGAKRGQKKSGRSNVDDALAFVASMKNGAIATFEASRVAPGHLNRNTIEINGELGSLAFDFEEMNVLRFFDASDGAREGGWRRIVCTNAGSHPYVEAWWPDAHIIGYEHGFTNMAADIMRVLAGEKPVIPLPDFKDAYQTQRVLEAALISAREGCSVPLREVR